MPPNRSVSDWVYRPAMRAIKLIQTVLWQRYKNTEVRQETDVEYGLRSSMKKKKNIYVGGLLTFGTSSGYFQNCLFGRFKFIFCFGNDRRRRSHFAFGPVVQKNGKC